MKKLIYKILLFVIPILIVLLIIEIQFKKIPNDYSYKANYVNEFSQDIEILVLGSSHSYRGVNPAHFEGNCFNFALVSQSVDYDYFILNKYINNLPNLRIVILPISYFTLTKKLEDGIESWRKYRYINYLDYDQLTLQERLSFRTYVTILQSNGKIILMHLYKWFFHNKSNVQCDSLGWGKWENNIQKNLFKTAKEAAIRHEDGSFEFEENLVYISNIIDICRSRNINIILFTPPATRYYYKELDNRKLELIVNKCKEIDSQNNNLFYRNYLNDDSFNDSLFRDGDHLNSYGAEVLSLKLNNSIINYEKDE